MINFISDREEPRLPLCDTKDSLGSCSEEGEEAGGPFLMRGGVAGGITCIQDRLLWKRCEASGTSREPD